MSDTLTKLTVNLIPASVRALDDAAAITGHSKTDTVNRALQVYLLLVGNRHIGERVYVGPDPRNVRELDIDWFGDEPTT